MEWLPHKDSQAVNGGLNRTSAAIFNDKESFGRLLDASFGFGLFGAPKLENSPAA